MNKLQEIKMSKAIEYGKQMKSQTSKLDYEDGFDDCLALDLSVKFAQWIRWEIQEKRLHCNDGNWCYDTRDYPFKKEVILDSASDKELYQYWIDNIYKPE